MWKPPNFTSNMWDNYAEETKPLFKLLRTQAFRFVLVNFNHYSLARRLKADLRERYRDRPFLELDARETSYRHLVDGYYNLGSGIFVLNNFEAVLTDTEKYTGLNLRRDKLAKYPIAMICFISPGSKDLLAKDILEKLPDLWSFRSLMIDLRAEVKAPVAFLGSDLKDRRTSISSLGGHTTAKKEEELKRLQTLVDDSIPENKALLHTLYEQIRELQKDLGLYAEAIHSVRVSKSMVTNKEDLFELRIEEGDLFQTIGEYNEAVAAFQKAEASLSERAEEDKAKLAIVKERLGVLSKTRGNIMEALSYFTESNKIITGLHQTYPQNVDFKNDLAISYERLGNTHAALGNLQQALAYYEDQTKLFEELYESFPQDDGFKSNLAVAYQYLGDVQIASGNLEQALAYHEGSKRLAKELYEAHPQKVHFKNNLAISYEKLGQIQTALGNLEQALGYYEKAVQLSKALYEAYPQNVDFINGLAISYSRLGNTQATLGNLQQAVAYYEQDARLSNKLYEAYPQNVNFRNGVAISYLQLGWFYQNKIRDKKKALPYLNAAKKIWEELVRSSQGYAEFTQNLKWTNNALAGLQTNPPATA